MASESYLASVAARLARKVSVDKAGQGRKGKWDPARTALLVDISTAHLAWPWLDDVLVDWQRLPFAAVAVCFSHLHGVSSGGAAGTGRIWTLLRGRAWNPSCPRSVSWPRQDTGKNDRSDRERLPRIGPLSGGACDDQATCTVSGHDRGNAQRTGLRLKRSGRTRQGRASVMRRLSRGGPV